MNPDEEECTDWKYLFEKSPQSYYFFKQFADFYKVSITLVLNYEDAIKEIIKPWGNEEEKINLVNIMLFGYYVVHLMLYFQMTKEKIQILIYLGNS